jgi:nucleoside-diphosphate-sugar epimerase
MRIFVIGGTRFIGPPTVRRLHVRGHTIALFHRGQSHAELPADIQYLTGDRKRLADHAETLRGFAPEVVLDMLPMTEQDALDVMGVFRGTARRIVAIGSQDVYRAYGRGNKTEPGPPDPVPLAEDAPLREKLYPHRGMIPNHDDYDKILVERVVMGAPDLAGTVLRLPMVYGPGDYQHRMFAYLKRMDDARPAIILPAEAASWRWTRGYVENVAEAIALTVTDDRAAGRIYNAGEADALTLSEWVRAIGDAAGWSGKIVTVPDAQLPEAMQAGIDTRQDLFTDSSHIRAELGYAEVIDRAEAIKETIAWERSHPPEQIDPAAFDYAAEDALLRDIAE